MATATAEQLVAQRPRSLMYLSRRQDLRLVRTPRYPQFGQSGIKIGEYPGQCLQFRDGRLDVPAEGKMTLEDGREVDAAEIAEWLETHRLLGDISEGFWKVDASAPPVSEEEISKLLEVSFDEERLRALIHQEETGWERPALLNPAREALERLLEVQAAMRAEAEEKAAAAVKPKAPKG